VNLPYIGQARPDQYSPARVPHGFCRELFAISKTQMSPIESALQSHDKRLGIMFTPKAAQRSPKLYINARIA
jgi:hypothetical protein